MKRAIIWSKRCSIVASLVVISCGDATVIKSDGRGNNFCLKPESAALTDGEGSSLGSDEVRALCDQIDQFECESRGFHPDVKTQTGSQTFCASLGGKEVCLVAVARLFDTSEARSPENEAYFAPGESYNYDEASCYHKGLKKAGSTENGVSGSGITLSEAFVKAHAACLRKAELIAKGGR